MQPSPTPKLRDRLLDGGVFGSMLAVWLVAYVALCPPQHGASRTHVTFAQASSR